MPRRSFLHDIEASERRGRWFPAFAGLLVISLLLSAWLGLFTFMGTTAAYGTFSDLQEEFVPSVDEMELGFPDLSRVSRVYASDGELLAELHDGRVSEPTPIEEIPDLVIYAVLAAEDSDFYEHEGVDFSAIASAALDNILYDTRRGGSTITQQVVKQNFVGDELTIRRKITEAFVSAELERRYSKDQILEFYLNSVFFGSNAYGVTAAAREFFGKELDDLAVHEAATLAVLVRNPSLYNPRKRPEVVEDRRNSVIREMQDKGWISETAAASALRQPLQVRERQQFLGPAEHVVAEVKRQLLHEPEFAFLGSTLDERTRAIFGCPADDTTCEGGGGLRIETTLDLDLQQQANDILSTWFPLLPYDENLAKCQEIFSGDDPAFLAVYAESNSCAPTGAIASVDNETGAVVVMASGLPFDVEQFDLVIQGRRNPGSAFKPITAAAALEQGSSLGTYWSAASPVEIDCETPCSSGPDPFIWTVNNFSSADLGTLSLAEATYRSVNTVYAQVAAAIGPENIVDMGRRMGITRSQLDPDLSITLGTSAVSPLEMATAFSNFATNGEWAEPYIITRIVDPTGQTLYERQPVVHQAADPAIFAAVRQALEVVPTSSGTAPRAAIGRPQGGKTGTHQNYQDAWFVGFVPQYSTAVWTGYPTQQIPLRNVVINGQDYNIVTGGRVPAPIWAEFMTAMLEDVPVESFPQVPAFELQRYLETPVVTVPSLVGLELEAALEELEGLGLAVEQVDLPSLEPVGTITTQSIPPGEEVNQGEPLTITISNGETPIGRIPPLIGLTWEEALERFEQLEMQTGVRVTLIRVNRPGPPQHVGIVTDVDPPPRTEVEFGRIVRVFVGV